MRGRLLCDSRKIEGTVDCLFLVAAIKHVFKHVGKRVFVFRLMQEGESIDSGLLGHPLAYALTALQS